MADSDPAECPGCRGVTTTAIAIEVARRIPYARVSMEARKLDTVSAPELLARLVSLIAEQKGRRDIRRVKISLEFDGSEWVGLRVPRPADVVRRRRGLTAVSRRA